MTTTTEQVSSYINHMLSLIWPLHYTSTECLEQ